MKNFKIFYAIIAIALTISSCEREVIGEIFDSSDSSDSLVSFESSSADLAVVQGTGGGTAEVIVESATLSNVDRVFNVSVNTELTTSPSEFFTLPNTVTIPAQSYEGTLTVSGIETSNFDMDTNVSLFIDLDSGSTPVTIGTIEVNIFLICPVPDTYFIGDYVILNTEQFIGPQFNDLNIEETTVAVTAGSTETERVFNARFLPRNNAAQPPNRFVIGLICGNVVLANEPAFRPGSALILTESGNNATYDLNDDSVITVNYFENPNDTNGRTGREASFIMIKQ